MLLTLTIWRAFCSGIACFFLSAVDICEIGLVTSRPLQILFMCTVDKYPRFVVWKLMKLDIDSNISFNDQQSENYDCNGHNGILMRVCDQNIVSSVNIATAPIPSIWASQFMACF